MALAAAISLLGLTAAPLRADVTTTDLAGGGTRTITTDPNGRVGNIVDKDANGNTTSTMDRTYNPNGTKKEETTETIDPKTGKRTVWHYRYDANGRLISGAITTYQGDKRIGGNRWEVRYKDAGDTKGKSASERYNADKDKWEIARMEPIDVTSVNGLVTATVPTKNGNLKILLPDDLSAGDTIAGNVVPDPIGNTKEEIAKNEDELTGYVVQVAGKSGHTGNGWTNWAIPAVAAGAVALLVLDKHGHEVARQDLPCSPTATTPSLIPIKPTDFHLPTKGQAGKPLTVEGPIGSDFTQTHVTLGGQDCPVLAASPRKLIAVQPRDVVGKTELTVHKDDCTASAPFRSIGLKLQIAKPMLHAGEKSLITITARGVQGMTEPLHLVVTNKSPNVAAMDGGVMRELTLKPGEGDECTGTVGLTGLGPGQFVINAGLTNLLFDTKTDIPNRPLAEETEAEKKHNALVGRILRRDNLKDQAAKADPKSDYGKMVDEAITSATEDVDKEIQGMTPDEQKKLRKELADWYRRSAEMDREMRDKARQKAADLQKQAANAGDPKEQQKLNEQADRQERSATFYEDEAQKDDAHAAQYEKVP